MPDRDGNKHAAADGCGNPAGRPEGLGRLAWPGRFLRRAISRSPLGRGCLIAAVCVPEQVPLLHAVNVFDHLAKVTDLAVVAA